MKLVLNGRHWALQIAQSFHLLSGDSFTLKTFGSPVKIYKAPFASVSSCLSSLSF